MEEIAGGIFTSARSTGPALDGMNNILTASRMSRLLGCPRAHFWQYEIGLTSESAGLALRVGSAWARAMEARWNGASYEEALAVAIPEGVDLDAYACATVSGLLAGYYEYYGAIEDAAKIYPEVQFRSEIEGTQFTAEGKLDGIGYDTENLSLIVESKTTGSSLDPDSDYWKRLAFNMQVWQYVTEARKLGWDVRRAIYDVTRKPSIRPKWIDDLDAGGRKIVVDQNGIRILLKAGKDKGKPRQTADKSLGHTLKRHIESPDEFCERLYRDTLENPSFYFCRREVPVIDDQLERFIEHRQVVASMIEFYRDLECKGEGERDEVPWIRNVGDSCKFCQFQSFCLSNHSIDINHPPQGFAIKPFNPELDRIYDTTETSTDDTTAQA